MKLSSLSGLLQFIIGFFLGMALLVGGAAAAAYFLLSNMTSSPPKPLFAGEKQELAQKTEKEKSSSPTASPVEAIPSPQEIPTGTYKAKVIWNSGLSLRAEPSAEAARLGTVPYKAEIMVLGTNGDNTWQKVRLLSTEQEGWIKGGNIEKID